MTINVTPEMGNSGGGSSSYYANTTIKEYDYPEGLNLKPGTALHERLIKYVMTRAEDSYRVMQNRHQSWRYIDQTMTAYIPVSEYEQALKKTHKTDEAFHPENRPTSIEVPLSYATEDTILTHFTSAFLNPPVFRFEGVGSEDEVGAALLQLVVDRQVYHRRAVLDLYAGFKDIIRYGLCSTLVGWSQEWALRPRVRSIPEYGPYGPTGANERIRETVETMIFEGSEFTNLDPYRILPDPNVSIHKAHTGEYFGWVEISSIPELKIREAAGEFFNVAYIATGSLRQTETRFTSDESYRLKFVGLENMGFKTIESNKVTLINMYCLVTPKYLKIGDSEDPEWWLMTIVDDGTLIRLERVDLYHGRFPVGFGATEFDGYSFMPVSKLEIVHGIQVVLNWMMNSHVANVRKAINDMIVYDPSIIYSPDLRDPEPGGLIRVRKRGWGLGLKDAIMQLPINDITRANVGDMSMLADLMQRASAATDPMQGMVRSGGERRSATEYRGTLGGSAGRLDRAAWVISNMYMRDLAYFAAMHTQQFMEEETFVKIVGSAPDTLKQVYGPGQKVAVTPFDLIVDFDINIKDGTTATAGSQNADVWVQLYQIAAANPLVAQNMDMFRIFGHIATLLGAKNIYDFQAKGGNMNMQVQPDAQVAAQAQAGNIIPINQAVPNAA